MTHDRLIGRNAQDAEELGLEIASFDDVFLAQTGTDGEVLPVPVKVPGRGTAVNVRPPTDEFYNEFLEEVDYDDDHKLARMITQAFPGTDVTEQDVAERALPFGIRVAVDMIETAGGKDMADALNQEQEREQFAMMQGMLGDDVLAELFEMELNEDGEIDPDDLPDGVKEAMKGNKSKSNGDSQLHATTGANRPGN